MDALLNRQLQNEYSNLLEQRVDVLIKKRELIQNRRSSVNGRYALNPCKHEHSNVYGFDTNRQKHRKHYQTTPM